MVDAEIWNVNFLNTVSLSIDPLAKTIIFINELATAQLYFS